MSSFLVRDVMSRRVWCVPTDARLDEVVRIMQTEAISCVVVIGDDEEPLGIISERDLVVQLGRQLGGHVEMPRAGHVMSSPLVTAAPTSTSDAAIRTMVDRRIRRLPVVSENGRLIGVVTQTDLMRGQLFELEVRTDTLEAQVERRTSELVATAKRLEVSNRQRGEFLATMSHEIRTPLSGILGTVELLMETLADASVRDNLETVAKSSLAMLQIVNDVLDLSKIDAGEFRITEAPFEPRRLVRDVVRLLDARARERGNTLGATIEDDVPAHLVGDALRLRQVLSNLVSNAVKFTEHGWVDVAVSCVDRRPDRSTIRLEVRDTGLGMQTADVERIFEPYEQVGDDAATHAQGTGLGLAICRRLTELMGGRIGVKSKRGSGSMFWMELELAVANDEETEPAEAFDETFDVRVLVVDDDAVSRRVLARQLESIGCDVDVACDGLEAVTKWSDRRYPIVFMDCEMPILDGAEATAEIRRRARGDDPYIVALTGHAPDAGASDEMDDHLLKPATRSSLAQQLTRYASTRVHAGAA